ncbi:glycosyltransferase family 4 protein [Porifericola rhodea]|uniref:glycosyltransferase family 4 protein n=1 Tax=Porifericola rhodea TaxID=930972 RepID=UPI002665AF62|nr:glycosyltransferase family 4 protein [Porifericola rhodea]WKN32524.1 glycosyltransferase family 4 protein [Porifericola rhodea]
MKKILVIGQTPPPYHGQALMTERLIKANLPNIKIYFIRLSFSKNISDVGKAGLSKVFHMVEVIVKGLFIRFRYGVKTLYYMPAGPARTPILRDFGILGVLRLFYPAVIFHFRAAGLSNYVDTQNLLIKRIAKYVYNKPKAAIQLSSLNPPDGAYFSAKKIYILPNGLEDEGETRLELRQKNNDNDDIIHILFVGMLSESKGVKVLLEAVNKIKNERIKVHFVGSFSTQSFEKEVQDYCHKNNLDHIVKWEGMLHGEPKWQQFIKADIFCFPTHYESEALPNVVVEAMMFSLPTVVTNWRGIPDIIDDGNTGWLVPPKDANLLALKLSHLIHSPSTRLHFGNAGRERYLKKFKLTRFLSDIEEILSVESQ